MGGTDSSKEQSEYLRVSIDYPHFKLDLQTSPEKGLSELRKILEALAAEESDEVSLFELKARLSEEFFAHAELQRRARSSLVLDEDLRVVKQVVPLEEELNLENGEQTRQVRVAKVKSVVASLFEGIAPERVRDCMVHLRGELSKEQQNTIMDAVKQYFGVEAHPRFFCTEKNLEGNVLVEAVCFGEGIAELEQW